MRTAKFGFVALRPLAFVFSAALFCLAGPPMQGQVIPVDVTQISGDETDPSIVLNSLAPNQLCVAAQIDGMAAGLCVAASSNSGLTWTTNIIATNNDVSGLTAAYGEPSLAWDTYGNLFLAYLPTNFEGIAIAVSTNGGNSFTAVTNLAPNDSTDQPRLTSPFAGDGAGSVWLVYKDYSLPNFPLVVQGLQSTQWGTNASFGAVQVVPSSANGGFADLTVGPLGQVMVVFQDHLEDAGPASIYASVNTNAVLTFPTNDANFTLTVIDSPQPVLAIRGTLPGYTYEILTNGDLTAPNWGVAQTLLASNSLTVAGPISEDSGPLFYEATLVRTPNLNLFSAGFSVPSVVATNAIGGSTYLAAEVSGIGLNAAASAGWNSDAFSTNFGQSYTVYTGVGSSSNKVIELCSSTNAGATWTAPVQVNDDTTANDHFLPRMAVDPLTGILAFSWLDCRNDSGAGSSLESIVVTNALLTLSNFVVTNISITNLIKGVVDPKPPIGNGTSYTIGVMGNNMYGNSTAVTNLGPVTVGGSSTNALYIYGAQTNVAIYFTGTNTGAGPPVTNTVVNLAITNIFPSTYTTGTPNSSAVMYSTLSVDGGMTFQPNQPVVSLATPINSPATGLASSLLTSTNLTGWGNYTGLVGYGGIFYFVWPDNSDITTNNPDGAGGNFDIYTSSIAITNADADLSVTVTNSPNPVLSDGVLVYTLTVSNAGPSTSGPIQLTNILSPNVTLEGGEVIPALGGTYSIQGSVVIFSLPALPAGASSVSTIRVSATQSSVATNIAIVSGPFIDLVPANNTNVFIVTIAGQDLAVNLSTSATNVLIGQTVTNVILVTNLGPAANGAVFVTNAYSLNWGGFTVQTPGAYIITNLVTTNLTNTAIIIALGLVAPNQVVTNIVTAVALSYNQMTNATTSVVVASQDVDTNLSNNSSNIVTFINDEDLAISMSASASIAPLGQPVTFSITVTNFGPSTSGLVTVTDTLSTNMGLVTNVIQSQGTYTIVKNQVIFSLGSLSNTQTATIAFDAAGISGPVSGTNIAVVSSTDFDTNAPNNSVTNTLSFLGEDLSLALVASTVNLQVGQTILYTNFITNLGPASNGVVVISNVFSARLGGFTVLQPSTGYTITTNAVIVIVGPVGTNQPFPVVVSATALSAGQATNTAVVSSPYFDGNLTNNTARLITTITLPLPIISNVVVTALASSAFVAWKTGLPATAQVRYGLTPSYGSLSSLMSSVSTQHVVLLTGLLRDTNYYFQINSLVGSTLYTTNGSFSTTDTLILNTGDASYTSGYWTGTSVGSAIYGTYYQFANTTANNPTASATYTPNIPAAGDYDVSVWYPISTNFTTNAQMYVSGATNELIDSVNQTVNGGSWQPLATNLYFASGTGGHVVIYNDTGETNRYVVANAMKWSYDVGQDAPTNGMVPGWWSTYYFGTNATVSGSADPDGDGYSNYAEYIFGTVPNDPASHLTFQVSQTSSGAVSISFSPYQGGRLYQLQSTDSVTNPQWLTQTNKASIDASGNGVFTLSQPNAANLFYRLSASVTP
ncbi:MAG TPA: hypothetical protein VFC44_13585 [Candidatus Saccharimonadales bacterium]|nr:hypothetical protein [Candidatus Saccharimonadales bacterium]